jgi:hypothetical protein
MTGLRGRALALASLSLIACSSGSTNSGTPPSDDGGGADVGPGATDSGATDGGGGGDASQTVTQTVGASGGTVTASGVSLTIPAGALSNDTQIAITTGAVAVPSGYVAVTPVYSFAPAGTTFAMPVTVALTLTGSGAGASVFWSNAAGGYDALPTTSTATSLSAQITHLGDGFGGEDRRDAGTSADAGLSNDTGTASDTGAPPDTGTAVEAGNTSDTGATTDSGATGDAGPSVDSGSAGDGEAGTGDSGTQETGASDAPPGDAPSEGGSVDAAADAGPPQGIFVTISGANGIARTFSYNVRAQQMQAWWYLYADDSASGPHWTMELGVPTNPGTLTCNGSPFLFVTYTHYTASGDAGTADISYTTVNNTASSCSITETTTATTPGQAAMGTFSGTLVSQVDGGNFPTETLTNGSYNIIVP